MNEGASHYGQIKWLSQPGFILWLGETIPPMRKEVKNEMGKDK